MPKRSIRKLKVFQAQFGFHDSVVAAPSQSAALRAWGIRQNLFAEGRAAITEDPQAVASARAHPETPLRRALGSRDPFELEPTALPTLPDRPKSTASKALPAPQPVATRRPPDRSALEAAEAALQSLDARRKREEVRLREKQADLDRETDARRATYIASRMDATAAVVKARQTYRKAGGNK